MCENIFKRAMEVIKNKCSDRELDLAIACIKFAYNGHNINTAIAENLDFSQLSFRCAYVYRHFTCIVIMTRRLWARVYGARTTEVKQWIKSKRSVNVCSLGGGPGTDIIAFQLFLKLENITHIKVNGVVFDKYVEWDDICSALAAKFKIKNENEVVDVKYKHFGVFDQPVRNDVIRGINEADVVSIVKFVSAVGYDREEIRIAMENLLTCVKQNALVFFLDNSDDEYARLMKDAADYANLRLIAELSHKKMRVPAGERKAMAECTGYVCNPQKNAIISACVWIKD